MAKPRKTGKPKASKANGHAKQKAEKPAGIGHNLTKIKAAVKKYATQHKSILDAKEKFDGDQMGKVRSLYEDAANDIGCPRKLIRIALSDLRREEKRKETERNFETEDQDTLEVLRDALGLFGDTPLGQAATRAATGTGEDASA